MVETDTRPSDLFAKVDVDGEYMFQCRKCGRTYYTRTGIKQHVVRKHLRKKM